MKILFPLLILKKMRMIFLGARQSFRIVYVQVLVLGLLKINLCVHTDYQSIGVGKQLLGHFISLARRQNLHRIFLEVRPTNFKAIKLYLSMGFNEVGKRRNYYPTKIGREDALILAKTLLKEEL